MENKKMLFKDLELSLFSELDNLPLGAENKLIAQSLLINFLFSIRKFTEEFIK
jgi:hypothetical protein